MEVKVVAERGTHVLIVGGERYAVLERRNGHFYNCHDDKRADVPVDDLQAVGSALDARDWTDRETAQATFEAVTGRGTELAQRML
jgi:hypothetical protein